MNHDSVAGLFVGILVGLTGMGGASIMAPILIFLFHYKAKTAVGADLAYLAVAKTFGAIQHGRAGGVNFKLVWQLSLGSVPASLLATYLFHRFDRANAVRANLVLTEMLGAILLVTAIILIARSFPPVDRWIESRRGAPKERGIVWAIAVGAIGGFLVGLTSVGAGTLFGVAFLLIFGLGVREMVGTDITHAAILSAAAGLAHVWAGDVDYGLVARLLLGAVPGILIGGYWTHRMPEKALRPTLATVLLIAAFRALL